MDEKNKLKDLLQYPMVSLTKLGEPFSEWLLIN